MMCFTIVTFLTKLDTDFSCLPLTLLNSLVSALATLGLVAVSLTAMRGLRLVGIVCVAMECTFSSCVLIIVIDLLGLMGVEYTMRSDDVFAMALAFARAALGLNLAAMRVLVLLRMTVLLLFG